MGKKCIIMCFFGKWTLIGAKFGKLQQTPVQTPNPATIDFAQLDMFFGRCSQTFTDTHNPDPVGNLILPIAIRNFFPLGSNVFSECENCKNTVKMREKQTTAAARPARPTVCSMQAQLPFASATCRFKGGFDTCISDVFHK